MAIVAYGLGLALIWVLAWGTPTPANILGGLAVAALLLVVVPDVRPRSWGRLRVRPIAVLRLVGFVLVQAVTANVQLTRAIISKDAHITTAVIAVPLPGCSDGLLTLITNALAITPGTLPIEVAQEPTTVYVHALLLGDIDQVRRSVAHLAALAYHAFGSDEAVAALEDLQRAQQRETAS